MCVHFFIKGNLISFRFLGIDIKVTIKAIVSTKKDKQN